MQPSSGLWRLWCMKSTLIAAAALLTLAALVGSPSVADAAAPSVELKPGSIERGADVAGPHVEGRTLVDGSMRMTFRAPRVTFLGRSGDRYVVHLSRKDGSNARIIWIRADESQRVLWRGLDASQVLLSQDGRHLVTTPSVSSDWTTIRVLDARSGRVLNSHSFRGSVSVLDVDDGRAVIGGWSPNRTFWWEFDGTDDSERISGRVGYAANIAAGRVASYTRDPYNGGCSVVTDLGSSPHVLWRSCDERVAEFAPNGRRLASIGILSDGLGPTAVTVRRTHGAALARYTAEWFGGLRWETNTALLLDTNGRTKTATVRCDVSACSRASDLEPVPQY
jgi:hypothetical protein